MKLYLSSYRIPDIPALEMLVGGQVEGLHVAVISNAKDLKTPESRKTSLRQFLMDLGKIGLDSAEVDLREFNDAKDLKTTLEPFDILSVTGGNSFVLRQRMRESGFDTVIAKLLQKGLVYHGESAGAVVAGSTIATAEVEDMRVVSEPILEGLGLLDKVIVPHANWRSRTGYMTQMQEVYGTSLLSLDDGQAHIVNH